MIEVTTPSHNRIPTLNKMGFMTIEHDIFKKAFMTFAQENKEAGPVLDIGCAYGVVATELIKNKVHVVACDTEVRHLNILAESITSEGKPYITLVQGILPETLLFENNSFQAILAASVFHFLKPDAIVKAFHLIFKWLKPGGKFFLTLCTPYQKNLIPFIETFNKRKSQNCPWPGEIEDYSLFGLPEFKDQMQPYFHVMDTETLKRVAEEAHFEIDTLAYYSRESTTSSRRLDGREHVGLICRKPQI